MYLDNQQVIERIKQNYLQGIQNQLNEMVKNNGFKISTFLYNVIFDKSYYQLTRVYNYSELELNKQIGKILVYPIIEQELENTQQIIQVIPLILLFLIGQKVDINLCQNQDNQNFWEMILMAATNTCNNDISDKEYFKVFQMNLETKFKQIQPINLEETVNIIVSSKKLLELLNLLFYQDYYHVAISSFNNQDLFVDFQIEKRLQIIMNSYQFLQQRDKGNIKSSIEDSKMKVAISFIEKNYNYQYLTERFNNIQAGIAIFSLIQLDHKQFQNFFYSKRPSVQEQLFNQLMDIAEVSENLFLNLLLVGKCLSKLRQWEYALKIYAKLLYLISNQQDKEKFRIYIQFKICKIQFLQGQISESKRKLKQLNNLIEKYENQQIEYYQPNNREIKHQSLIISLLISVYTNQIDLKREIMIKISPIIKLINQSTQKRYFNMLQYEFFRLIQQQGMIFRSLEGQTQLDFILKKTQQVCQERQDIEQKSNNFLAKFKSIFNSPNQKGEKLIQIKSYYRAIEEFLIINVLLRKRDICILQYFNPNLYPLLRVFLEKNFLYNLEMKSEIYFFIHDFEEAYQLAKQTKNEKMIGQILEYCGKYEDAIKIYKNIKIPNIEISCAILLKILNDENRSKIEKCQSQQNSQENAITYFLNLVQKQGSYKILSQKYLEILLQRSDSQVQLSEIIAKVEVEKTLKNRETGKYQQSEDVEEIVQTKSQDIETFRSVSQYLQEFQLEEDQLKQSFNFPIRKDIRLFYHRLRNDLKQEQDGCLINLLDEFVKKTQFLKYETEVLFNNNDDVEQLGQGGNSKVYKFNFQDQSFAAKEIQLEYMENNINQDVKSDIESKLLEICIVCDITISKTKYCLGIEHLGLFSNIQGQLRSFQIILITKIYNNYQEMINWNEIDKIKYVYKLSLGLTTLQLERKLLHLDLKPDNVLVDKKKKNPIIVDFGLSKYSHRSQNLSSGIKQMTYKYVDPELGYSNFQSRKNDVYSFGVTLFQYFSGCIPYEGIQDCHILGRIKYFQEHHKVMIQNIKNNLIQDLIIDCTQPIANRISFIQVIKRLFMYQYQIINPQVKQLIEILFDHIEYLQNERKINTIYPYIKVMKSFIKYTNSFQTTTLENKVLQNYIILSSKTSTQSFPQIIQRMKYFINWASLNQHDFVLKLLDFQMNFNQIHQDKVWITFNFWVEDAQNILQTNMILQIPFYLRIIEILKQIHQYSICLLYISLEKIYIKDDKIILNCFEYSQNLKIDQNKLYELNCQKIDPDINQSMKYKYENDIYALFVLIEQTKQQMKLDQDIQDKVTQFLQIFNQNQVISLEEIIGKLQH